MPGERSDATTLAPSRAHATAKLPSPGRHVEHLLAGGDGAGIGERLGGGTERLGQLGVVAEPPHVAVALLDGVQVHRASVSSEWRP